jgi:hypothetical protein
VRATKPSCRNNVKTHVAFVLWFKSRSYKLTVFDHFLVNGIYFYFDYLKENLYIHEVAIKAKTQIHHIFQICIDLFVLYIHL